MADSDIETPQLEPNPHEKEDAQAGRRMTVGALVISLFLFLGKIAGYLKDIFIAKWFGKSHAADAYNLIYSNIIFMIYARIEKIMRPIYLPTFVATREKDGEEEAWKLTSTLATLQFLFLLVIVALVMIFAPQIIRTMWGNLAADPEGFKVAVMLLRVTVPTLLLFSLSVMPELTLHAYKRFSLPAFADACFRTALVGVMILGIVFIWSPDHPYAILAAGLGVVIGGALRFLIMLPGLWSKLKYYRPMVNPVGTPAVRTVFALMPPVLVGILASTAREWADSIYAVRLGEGMYTCLRFGRKMGDAPLQIIPLAVSFVVYPFLSEWAARQDKQRLADALVGMTRAMAFFFVPMSVALMLLARPIISLMFEHGEFTAEGAYLSSIALFTYAPGLMFFAMEASINKWYFALGDTRTPNYWGAGMALLHIIIGYIGIMVLYPAGRISDAVALAFLALALTLSKSLKVIVLYGLVVKRIGAIDYRRFLHFVARLALATGLMGISIHVVSNLLDAPLHAWQPPFAEQKLRMAVLAGGVGAVGTVVYLVTAGILRIEEMGMVWAQVRKKLAARRAR